MKDIKRFVSVSFWSDEKIMDFSPEDKYFMLYLLTNPHTTQLGIYHLPIKKASFDLGYTQEAVKVLLDRFQNVHQLIKYSEQSSEVAIKNFLIHSIVRGGQPVYDCLVTDMKAVKDKELLNYIYESVSSKNVTNLTTARFLVALKKYIDSGFDNVCKYVAVYVDNISFNNDNDNDNDNDVSSTNRVTNCRTNRTSNRDAESINGVTSTTAKAVIDYLNNKAGTHFQDCRRSRTYIKTRIGEGFTLYDFKTVIDKKVKEWNGTDMQQYLRPETLFGPKFEGYLNAKESVQTKRNEFNDFPQRDYDYNEIERQILGQQLPEVHDANT